MPEKTRLGKCGGEGGGGGEGSGDGGMLEYIAWDKSSEDTEYLEELVKNKLISESAAPKKVWTENSRFLKYSSDSFQSALNKAKNKYQFHMRPPTKNPPLKVHVEVIKKGPLADPLSSSSFITTNGGMKDKTKGRLCCSIWFGCCIAFLTIAPKQVHWISM